MTEPNAGRFGPAAEPPLGESDWQTFDHVVAALEPLPRTALPSVLPDALARLEPAVAALVRTYFGACPEFDRRLEGTRLDRYLIETTIGRGSTGVVYRARDDLGVRYALKVLVAAPRSDTGPSASPAS